LSYFYICLVQFLTLQFIKMCVLKYWSRFSKFLHSYIFSVALLAKMNYKTKEQLNKKPNVFFVGVQSLKQPTFEEFRINGLLKWAFPFNNHFPKFTGYYSLVIIIR